MPYPYISEQQSLARRRALAQALQSQSFEPLQEPNYPGAAISPVQGVARMVQALMGGLAQRRLDKEQTGLESKIQDERTRRALQMMDALVPQAQGSSVNVGMAPMQSMPYPGGTSQDMTPPGDRSVGFPPSPQALDARSQQVQALGAGFASPMPAEQGMAQALLSGMMERGKEGREEASKMRLEKFAAQLSGQDPLKQATADYYKAHASALSQPDFQFFEGGPGQPYGTINKRTGELNLKGTTPAAIQQPVSVGSYVNPEGKHVQIMREPDGSLKETVLNQTYQPPHNVTIRTVDAQGNPVERIVPNIAGAEYAGQPTTQEQNRRDQANIVMNYADHVMDMIDKNPNAVGPILGRLARAEVKIGDVPPEVKALHTALGSFKALQPILHGFRGGSQTVEHFEEVIGDQRLNAAALKASLNEIKTLASSIRGGNSGNRNVIKFSDLPQ